MCLLFSFFFLSFFYFFFLTRISIFVIIFFGLINFCYEKENAILDLQVESAESYSVAMKSAGINVAVEV